MALSKDQLNTVIRKNPVGVACGLLCLLLGGFAYWRSDAIPEAETQLQTSTTQADRLGQNISNAAHLKDQYDQLLSSARTMEPRITRTAALADNQRYFYRLEAATGTKLIDLRQGTSPGDANAKPAAGAFYIPVSFTVVVQGDYSHVLAFLREVEGGFRFSRITSVTITPAASAQVQSADLEVTGSLLTMSINLDQVGVP